MKKRETKKKAERLIIDGKSYLCKWIGVDKIEVQNCLVCLHTNKPFLLKNVRLLFANRESNLWCEPKKITVSENTICFDLNGLSIPETEDKQKYTCYLFAEEKQEVYAFCLESRLHSNTYNHLQHMFYRESLSNINGKSDTDKELVLYVTDKEQILKMSIQEPESYLRGVLDARIYRVRFRKGRLFLHIKLEDYGYEISRIYMQLRSKVQELTYDFQIKSRKRKKMFYYIAEIQVSDLKLEQFYWDIRAVAVKGHQQYDMELRNRDLWLHRLMYLRQMKYRFSDGTIVYPYKTKSNTIALYFRQATIYDNWKFIAREYLALLLYYLSRFWMKRRKIWIVYEKYCMMAQDNGFYFFRYCMEQLPKEEQKRIYYVIDKHSPDYSYVKSYKKNVLHFLGLKHMVYLMSAQLLISSDTKAHAYAWHSPDSVYRNMLKRKENIFLQHGVIAFKTCHQGLKKRSVNGSTCFVVSSDVEKQIILDHFGYEEEEILVTGLARWDVLEDKSAGEPCQIILMPTWRNWLEEVTEETFRKSQYYQHYMELLNHPLLAETLRKHQIILNFYIHPKFREYLGAFQIQENYIRLIPFGAEPLNELMMRCSMMITDYSSAVWDVFYQGKPVLFYLFDLELYQELQGSYIDMERESFGDTAYTPEELAALILEYADNGFREKQQYAKMREKQIRYIDKQNSARIYQEIIQRYPVS